MAPGDQSGLKNLMEGPQLQKPHKTRAVNFAGSPTRHRENVRHLMGFPGGSGGREAACTAGDRGSIPGLGRALEEGEATPHFKLTDRIRRTLPVHFLLKSVSYPLEEKSEKRLAIKELSTPPACARDCCSSGGPQTGSAARVPPPTPRPAVWPPAQLAGKQRNHQRRPAGLHPAACVLGSAVQIPVSFSFCSGLTQRS